MYSEKLWLDCSLCSYVCLHWPEIFCLKALVLSVRMYVLAFQDQHTLPKWNILSDQIKWHRLLPCVSIVRGKLVLNWQKGIRNVQLLVMLSYITVTQHGVRGSWQLLFSPMRAFGTAKEDIGRKNARIPGVQSLIHVVQENNESVSLPSFNE